MALTFSIMLLLAKVPSSSLSPEIKAIFFLTAALGDFSLQGLPYSSSETGLSMANSTPHKFRLTVALETSDAYSLAFVQLQAHR